MLEHGETWTLDNDKEYIVASIVEEQAKKYVYLLNQDDFQEYIIAEYDNEEVIVVEEPELVANLLLKFNSDLKTNLPRIISEIM